VIKLDETSFSLSSSVAEEEEWAATASIDLPLFDQLGLNGALNDDSSGKLGLTFSPLYHSDSREQLSINYEKALLLAEETAVLTENHALSAALNWMSARQQLSVQEEIVAVKETVYRDQKVRYEAGESTLDDVRDDLVAWTEARTTLSKQQTLLRSGESELLQTLGTSLDAAGVGIISSEILRSEMEALKSSLTPEAANPSQVYEVTSSYKSVESSREKLSDTWMFDPTLNLAGNINLPSSSDALNTSGPGWEASIQMVFSLDDWQGKERDENRKILTLALLEAQQAERESQLNLQQVLITLENTEQNRVLAELEMEQSEELYEEAQFLQKAGDYSSAESEDARLLFEQARVNYFDMLAGEFLAWRDLLLYL
jgi:outer membrane protein TolC